MRVKMVFGMRFILIKKEEKLQRACEVTLLLDHDSLHFSYLVLPDIVLTITCIMALIPVLLGNPLQ